MIKLRILKSNRMLMITTTKKTVVLIKNPKKILIYFEMQFKNNFHSIIMIVKNKMKILHQKN